MLQRNILIVDDDKNNVLVLGDFLKGFRLLEVSNVRETMQTAALSPFELIIINMQTKGLDTIHLIESLKRLPLTSSIPVVVLGNGVNTYVEDRAFELGVDDYINLKSSISTISSRILRVIDYQRCLKEIALKDEIAEDKIERMQKQIIESFASIIEGRDSSTGAHIKRTAAYVEIVIRGLIEAGDYLDELTEGFCESCVAAAPLHDIGKITVSDVILCKPGKLTVDEFMIMQTHARIGGKMIAETLSGMESSLMLSTAVDMATYHHEKWNGTGYPFNLVGEDIPLCARIMAIADVFDALVSKRCYKEPVSYEQAFDIICDESGRHFDPKIVEVFMKLKDEVVKASDCLYPSEN
jgi:putative two-component system response regulator